LIDVAMMEKREDISIPSANANGKTDMNEASQRQELFVPAFSVTLCAPCALCVELLHLGPKGSQHKVRALLGASWKYATKNTES
jgi:hypothetical protein